MKQIRWITHNDQHVDEETLINGVWAVTRCDVKLYIKDNHMPQTKPIELTNAIIASDTAWDNYDASIEAGASKEERQERWNVVNWLEERKGQQYTAWQNAGGTSDIDCVTFNDPRTPAERDHDEAGADLAATQRDAM